jgi:hypothetical protein
MHPNFSWYELILCRLWGFPSHETWFPEATVW